jgi:hypothetical protein
MEDKCPICEEGQPAHGCENCDTTVCQDCFNFTCNICSNCEDIAIEDQL